MTSRIAIVITIATGVIAGASEVGLAAISRETTYSMLTADGEHVLVMISSEPLAEDGDWQSPREIAEIHRLRKTYAASGLYRIGDSTTPVWVAPSFAYYSMLSSDGRYAVASGSSAGAFYITFYERGHVLNGYGMQDLVGWPSLMWWRITGSVERQFETGPIVKPEMTLACKTQYGTSFVFDVTTGDIVHEHRPAT